MTPRGNNKYTSDRS